MYEALESFWCNEEKEWFNVLHISSSFMFRSSWILRTSWIFQRLREKWYWYCIWQIKDVIHSWRTTITLLIQKHINLSSQNSFTTVEMFFFFKINTFFANHLANNAHKTMMYSRVSLIRHSVLADVPLQKKQKQKNASIGKKNWKLQVS